MKIKATISVIMALLMIASTVVVVAGDQEECGTTLVATGTVGEYGEVIKEVWNGTAWVDYIEAEVDDVLHFRITLVYHCTEFENAFSCRNINITDILPNCLDYNYDADPENTTATDKEIFWDSPVDEPIHEGDTIVIHFNATVVDCTEPNGEENFVEVDALEKCSSVPLYQNDTVTIVVPCEEFECGEIEVTKKIFDGEFWVDTYEAELGEDVLFNITITYHAGTGECNTLGDIVVEDYHNFVGVLAVTWTNFNYIPSEMGDPMVWNLSVDYGVTLLDGESVSITYTVTPVSFEGLAVYENCVDVYATEHCCECPLCGSDCANFTVEEDPCEPEIEVIKKVWNGTAWAELIEDVVIDQVVRFKIDVIYHACDDYKILNMEVRDELPCCLEFLGNTVFTSTGTIHDDATEEVVDGKVIFWNWTYAELLELVDGDSLTIEFDAIVTQYCEGIYDNWAYVEAWGCKGPTLFGEDNASINCTSPTPKFDKKARVDGLGPWLDDEIEVKQGDTLQFALILEYYGAEALDEIQFVDELPCILEYNENSTMIIVSRAGSPAPTPVDVTDEFTIELSADGKTIWFNSTGGLLVEDGRVITVFFDVTVVGVTSECQECPGVINYAYVTGKIGCVDENNFFMEDEIAIISGCPGGNCPPSIPLISGPTKAKPDLAYIFDFISTDPDGDQIYYMIDIDGETTEWIGPYDSGVKMGEVHTFESPGTYLIKAKAKDSNGAESGWTPEGFEHEVVVSHDPVTPEEKELNVTVKDFSIGRVVFNVENIGELDMENIDWIVNLTGGLLDGVQYEANCSIDSLEVGDSVQEVTGWPVGETSIPFGFGKVTIKISLTDGDYAEDFEFEGFLIGKILILTTMTAQ